MVNGFVIPTSASVGAFYDECNGVLTEVQGDNMHYGYWTGPDDDSDYDRAATRLTDLLIAGLDVGPGDTVLDLGCGTGAPGVRLAQQTGARVVGISISVADVALANRRAAAAGVAEQVSFRHADANDLPFAPMEFDAVMAVESIVHMPDRPTVFREVARVLRPGGRFVLTDFVQLVVPEDELEENLLVEALAAWHAAPLMTIETYPELIGSADLVLDGIRDITENTKYTFRATHERLDQRRRADGYLPAVLERVHRFGQEIDWALAEESPQAEGVVLVTAHRGRVLL